MIFPSSKARKNWYLHNFRLMLVFSNPTTENSVFVFILRLHIVTDIIKIIYR